MKYWDKLNEVENGIIKLDTIESLLRVVGDAAHPGTKNEYDIQHCIWNVSEQLEEINKKLSEDFQQLWDEVRKDSDNDESEYLSPSEASTELMNIVNSWDRELVG
jgi:uncharacterized coiled-coil DUF342 family protein